MGCKHVFMGDYLYTNCGGLSLGYTNYGGLFMGCNNYGGQCMRCNNLQKPTERI